MGKKGRLLFALATAGDGGIRLWTLEGQPQIGGGGRGEICGFSQASRRRLIDKLMLVPWSQAEGQTRHDSKASIVLLTLTYPSEYPQECATTKRHLANFRRELDRVRPGGYSAIWRLEYQKRGAPHYHILVLFNDPIRIGAFGIWARATWFRVVGSADPAHLEHGADVRVVTVSRKRPGALLAYLVKYLGKVAREQFHTGRIWGVWGKLPEVITCAVSFETAQGYYEFLRRVRKWGKRSRYLRQVSSCSGLRLYCYGTNVLFQLARSLPGVDVFKG